MRTRKEINYRDLNNGLFAAVPPTPTTGRARRRTLFKFERQLLSYELAQALKRGNRQLQTISIVISESTEKGLIENFGIIPNRHFSENERFFDDFGLPTASLQRNDQLLLCVAYAKKAEHLKVRIRKKKQLTIMQESGQRQLKGHSLLVVQFKIVRSIHP